MASPFFFVDKKDGKLRPCQDYWALNEGTIKNAYPLPLISELIDKLKGAKYFTKLDVRWGYNNVRIKDGDQWKAAFKTNKGLFEPTVMFFGLCNSPATFQSMMDNLFIFETSEGWVIIYMDDIFIFTKEIDDNIQKTQRILQQLTDNDLYLKPEKCVFWQTKVEYLGLIIEENKLTMDPVKLSGIANWPTPNTLKQVHSFLGFGNYYWRFIQGYGNLTRPLNELLKKEEKFVWTDERNQAFETLKQQFLRSPVLQMPTQHYLSLSKPTPQNTPLEQYSSSWIPMEISTHADISPSHSTKQSKTTKYTTENS